MNRNARYFLSLLLLILLSSSLVFAADRGAGKTSALNRGAGFGSDGVTEYIEGEAIVLLKPQSGAKLTDASFSSGGAAASYASSVAKYAGANVAQVYESLSVSGNKVFMFVKSPGKTTKQLISDLYRNSSVLSVSPNFIGHYNVTPNDPRYNELWGMEKINMPAAWNVSTGSSDVYVAVVDSGINAEHEDLAANTDIGRSKGFDYNGIPNDKYTDSNGHGTHVAGTIGAVGSNDKGVAGVNWTTKIIALNIDNGGKPELARVIAAVEYLNTLLSDDVKVASVNFSIGMGNPRSTPKEVSTQGHPLYNFYYALKQLDDTDKTVIVSAAGNNRFEIGSRSGIYAYPACFPLKNSISVGAAGENDKEKPGFSNYGSAVDMAAPGVDILSAKHSGNNEYIAMNGTSMAAPHVTGAAALLAAASADAKASDIKTALLATANPDINPTTGGIKLSQRGLLNVAKAINALKNGATYHTITATTGENGVISPSGGVKITAGENLTFVVTPNIGYEISSVKVDGTEQAVSNKNYFSHNFNSVTSDHTIAAEFSKKTAGATYYVTESGAGNKSGSDWNNALSAAQLPAVLMNAYLDTFYVAKGVYKPTTDSGSHSAFVLNDKVKLYGSLAGSETNITRAVLDARNFAANKTTLSGNMSDRDKSHPNSANVLLSTNSSRSSLLDGFEVTDGLRGMLIEDGSPTVINCTFVKNTGIDWGAGMLSNSGAPYVSNCTFADNSASDLGGGMLNLWESASVITNCTFSGNSAPVGGGMLNWSSNALVTNCTFADNRAETEDGGSGVLNISESTPMITNCIFRNKLNDEISCDLSSSRSGITYCVINETSVSGRGNINKDPKLSRLDHNGGSTMTCAIAAGSSAINTGVAGIKSLDLELVPKKDQRGIARNGNPDIGAFEFTDQSGDGAVTPDGGTPSSADESIKSPDLPSASSGTAVPDDSGKLTGTVVELKDIPRVASVTDQASLNTVGVEATVENGRVVLNGEPKDVGTFTITVTLPDGTQKQVQITIAEAAKSVETLVAPDKSKADWTVEYSGSSEAPSFVMWLPVTVDSREGFTEQPTVTFEGASGTASIVEGSGRGASTKWLKISGTVSDRAKAAVKSVQYRIGALAYIQAVDVKLTDTKFTDKSTDTRKPNGGSGCDSGFGVPALLALCAVLLRRRA